jgi:hypothetical protein
MINRAGTGINQSKPVELKLGISKTEFAAKVESLASDGEISKKDFLKLSADIKGGHVALTEYLKKYNFKADLNGAFKVARPPGNNEKAQIVQIIETAGEATGSAAQLYKKIDRNHDGKISLNELKVLQAEVKGGFEVKFRDFQEIKMVCAPRMSAKLNEILSDVIKQSRDIFCGKSPGVRNIFDPVKTTEECYQLIEKYPAVKGFIFSTQTKFPPGISLPGPEAVTQFFSLINDSEAPTIDGKSKNPFEHIVGKKFPDGKSYIDRFNENLLKSAKTNMTPADVFKCALDATGGDYALASLTAHNGLKYLTYQGRGYNGNFQPEETLSSNELKIISKLGNLRVTGSSNDKMGPWYHFFCFQALNAYTGDSGAGKTAAGMEHASRSDFARGVRNAGKYLFENLGYNPANSPSDPQKAAVDDASCSLADKLHKNSKLYPFRYEFIK